MPQLPVSAKRGRRLLLTISKVLPQILSRETANLVCKGFPSGKKIQFETPKHALQNVRAVLSGQERLGELQTELGTVCARYEDSKERHDKLRRQLEMDEQEQSDQQLQFRIDAARAESAQEKAVAELQTQHAGETLPQLEVRKLA